MAVKQMPDPTEHQLPLASRVVFETGDLLAARDHLSRFLWPHTVMPTERGPVHVAFRHCKASLGQSSVHALTYGAPVKIDARPDDSYLFLVLLGGEGRFSQDGFEGQLNSEIVRPMNPTGVATMRFSPGETNLTLRIPGPALREWLEHQTGRPIKEPLRFQQQANPMEANAPGLRRFLDYACGEFDRRARTVENPASARQLEQTLFGLVMTQLPHNYSEALGGEPLGPAPDYIRMVEEFIASHAGESLSLRELVEVAGVSERSLQAGFRRYRDTTPMEYLRDHRLELASRALRNARLDGRSVTEIAMASGFTHLGKFAKCYRERFGEAPSDTRRRALDSATLNQ